ncbi:MAG: PDZ domain-containing protein [Chthonomonadaceae bacterium]|nr:PDZ domain-containing protein [Chthonomonadaceae bacterium]
MHTVSTFLRPALVPVAFSLLFASTPVPAQEDAHERQDKQVLASRFAQHEAAFEKVWKTTQDHFYDTKMNGVDWNVVKQKYKPLLREAVTKPQFADLMKRMLEELHVSHTDYLTDDDYGFYMFPSVISGQVTGNEAGHIGITGRSVKGGYEVTAVLDDSPAEKSGLEIGDIIIGAEGKPFTTVGSFRGKEGKSVTLQVLRLGSVKQMEVVPVKENILGAFLRATEKSAKIIEIGGKRIGYLHLWTMGTDAFKTAMQSAVMGKLYRTDGLILDIRDGFGGRPFGYSDIFHKPAINWRQTMRGITTDQKSAYGKPMVLLINGGSRSAKEYFAFEFKKTGRATLVGTTTAGAFLGASGYPISKEGFLEIPIVSLTLDGRKLEGKGVSPDIEVKPSTPGSKDDAQLKKAQEVLLQKIKIAPPTGEREVIIEANF